MEVLRTILTIVFIAVSAALVIVILMQQGKDRGLGAIAGMSSGDTYWSRNKGRSKEGQMIRITRVLAIAFVALAVILNIKF